MIASLFLNYQRIQYFMDVASILISNSISSVSYFKIRRLLLIIAKIKDQVIDIFTKPLKVELFFKLKRIFGIVKYEDFDLKEAM